MGLYKNILMVRYLCIIPLIAIGSVLTVVGIIILAVSRPGVERFQSVAGNTDQHLQNTVRYIHVKTINTLRA